MVSPTAPTDSAKLAEWLTLPTSYPEKTGTVSRCETHISLVFLTDGFAYKLKKLVRYDFLDFSTAELRQTACTAEVELNRRLSPDVYLGVVPVYSAPTGGFTFQPVGDPVDYLVKMRRLPAERTLAHLLQERMVQPAQLDAIIARLLSFYRSLPSEAITPDEYRAELRRHVTGNRNVLQGAFPQAAHVRSIHNFQQELLTLRPELFDRRVQAGRIVEGHGDLRPDHIYLTESLAIVDCIEFNREFRTLDELDEVCFLATECHALGSGDAGERLLRAYGTDTGDHPPPELTACYRSYRACVRAKVHALRAAQLNDRDRDAALTEAEHYLDLAQGYIQAFHRPRILIVGGISGSGKSTLATELANTIGAQHLATDWLRQEVVTAEADRYSTMNKQRIYDRLLSAAAAELHAGTSVVLDGTFLQQAQRNAVKKLAHDHNRDWHYIDCRCPVAIAAKRIRQRRSAGGSLSEAPPELPVTQAQERQIETDSAHTLIVDTSQTVSDCCSVVLEYLQAHTRRTEQQLDHATS